MAATRKHFSSEQKVKIIKMHLVEGIPLSDLCDRNGIHPSVFYRWQKAFFERGYLAFENSDSKKSNAEKKITTLKQEITDKNEVLAELMEEHVALKKSLGKT